MPEQEPQVGQAERSTSATSASEYAVGRDHHGVDQVQLLELDGLGGWPAVLPASIGPPETKITGMFRRIAAISMPG
jgi:hypothetical protein